uniref:Uncharacterized protein n=1 Tax=uncultured marine virus TaxID=186617 RepID=A0A0F7L569_9VIRU|nr:hypothetical protein [uncultured marine virus]
MPMRARQLSPATGWLSRGSPAGSTANDPRQVESNRRDRGINRGPREQTAQAPTAGAHRRTWPPGRGLATRRRSARARPARACPRARAGADGRPRG